MIDKNNIDTIWQDLSMSLLKFIRSKVSSIEEAEDILQNVFIKIYNNIDGLIDEKKIKSWIYNITRNTIYDYYKQKRVNTVEFEDNMLNIADREDEGYLSEISSCIISMIKSLPTSYSEALLKVDIEGLSQKQLAEDLDISIPGAKSRVQRGRKILKEIFLGCCELEINKHGKIIDINPNKNCDKC